jgi:phage-related protein
MVYIQLDIIGDVRPVCFLGDSLKSIRDFPEDVRHDVGYQLDKVQRGDQPEDFKPMPGVGKGVEEMRVSEPSGTFV